MLNVEEFVGSLMTDFVGYRWTDGWMNKCMNGLAAYVDDCLVVYKLWLSWLVMKLKKNRKIYTTQLPPLRPPTKATN